MKACDLFLIFEQRSLVHLRTVSLLCFIAKRMYIPVVGLHGHMIKLYVQIDSLSCLKMSIDHIREAFKYGLIKTQKPWLTSNSTSALCFFVLFFI